MNAKHSKTIQELDESLTEANRIKHSREKHLHRIKIEVEKMKLLLAKMNKAHGFIRTDD